MVYYQVNGKDADGHFSPIEGGGESNQIVEMREGMIY